MGSGAENIYTLPPPVVLPLGEAPARGEGEPQDRDPGPDLAPSRQSGGLPAPPALGSGAGRRVREGRGGSKTRRVGRRRGGGPAARPAAHPPHGSGWEWGRGTGGAGRAGTGRAGLGPALPHGRRAAPGAACHGSGRNAAREEKLLASLPGTLGAGSGVTGR